MRREYQALIDRDVERLKRARTKEEKRRAMLNVEATKSVINALMFSKDAMEKLS